MAPLSPAEEGGRARGTARGTLGAVVSPEGQLQGGDGEGRDMPAAGHGGQGTQWAFSGLGFQAVLPALRIRSWVGGGEVGSIYNTEPGFAAMGGPRALHFFQVPGDADAAG